MEKHFAAEISVRPDDMNLRLKQLKLFESSNRLSEAFSYAINLEKTSKFQKDDVKWYEAVSRICEVSINYKYILSFRRFLYWCLVSSASQS